MVEGKVVMKKILLKSVPYFVSICTGFLFFFFASHVEQYLGNLFISLSAAFLAIPLIFLFYETVKNLSQRKLNKEIFDYAKVQIDSEVLTVLNYLSKIVFGYKARDFSDKGVNDFLKLNSSPKVITFATCILPSVRVPVLSVQIIDTLPKVSAATS